MTPRIIFQRGVTRLVIATMLILGMVAILLVIILYSHLLAGIDKAGWGVFTLGVGLLGQTLLVIVRAIAQNPSDRTKVTEEE